MRGRAVENERVHLRRADQGLAVDQIVFRVAARVYETAEEARQNFPEK